MNERKKRRLDRMVQALADSEYPEQNVEASITNVETDYTDDTEVIWVDFFRPENVDWGFHLKIFARRSDKPLFIMGMIAQSLMDRETH